MGPSSRLAIVTGTSRGIGRAIASRLAADGFAVVVNYASKRGEAEQVIEAIRAAGGKAVTIQADVSKPEDVTRLFEETGRLLGGVDVLVNNAGIMELKMVGEVPDELFDRTIAINVRGTFYMMRAAAKALRSGGRIINFSSSVLGLALPTYAVYSAGRRLDQRADDTSERQGRVKEGTSCVGFRRRSGLPGAENHDEQSHPLSPEPRVVFGAFEEARLHAPVISQ